MTFGRGCKACKLPPFVIFQDPVFGGNVYTTISIEELRQIHGVGTLSKALKFGKPFVELIHFM
jgi:hypothetical protein